MCICKPYSLKRNIAIILTLCIHLSIATLPDSVLIEINTKPPVEACQFLKNYAYKTYPFDKEVALSAGRKSLALAKENLLQSEMAIAYKTIGVIHGQYSSFDSSNYYYERALEITNKHELEEVAANVEFNIGINHFYQGNYSEALKHYYKCLEIFRRKQDTLGIPDALSNIGMCYSFMNEYNKAIGYLKEAAQLYENLKMNIQLLRTYTALGANYTYVLHDSAFYFFNKGLELAGDEPTVAKANLFINLGTLYSEAEDKLSALESYEEAYNIQKSLNNKKTQAEIAVNIGKTYNDLGKYREAVKYLEETYSIANEIGSLELLSSSSAKLSFSFKNLGDFASAFHYLEMYKLYDDSIYNEESRSEILELDAKYQAEKKASVIANQKAELANKNLELESRKRQNTILYGSLGLLFVIGFVIAWRIRENTKQAKLKAIRDIHQERVRISRDLHDNIGAELTLISSVVHSADQDRQAEYGTLKEIEGYAKNAISQLRETVWVIQKELVELSEFQSKVNEYGNKLCSATRIQFEISEDVFDSICLAPTRTLNLYRICQEVLNNSVKHSGASLVKFNLWLENNDICVKIWDNGKGFNIDNVERGYGLDNMSDRIDEVGGVLSITSAPDQGTEVMLKVEM